MGGGRGGRERGEEREGGGGPVGSMRGKDVFRMSATFYKFNSRPTTLI